MWTPFLEGWQGHHQTLPPELAVGSQSHQIRLWLILTGDLSRFTTEIP